MPLQEEDTATKYAGVIAAFLWHIIRQIDTPLDNNFHLHTCHSSKLEILKEQIHGLPENPDAQSFNPLAPLVSDILYSLFRVNVRASDNQFWYPAMQFLALVLLKSDGSFMRPDDMTRFIAALQYGVRLSFADAFMKASHSQPAWDADNDPEADTHEDWSIFRWLHNGRSAPFNQIRQTMHLATTLFKSEAMPDTTYWADHKQETLEVGSKTVTVSGIRKCIHKMDTLVEADFNSIIKGIHMPDLDFALYVDKPNNTSPGFNYFTHSQLTHKKHHLHLVKEWITRKDVFGVLQDAWKDGIVEGGSGLEEAIWSPSGMWKVLDLADRVLERIYFLYHVACGQPIRGTEESGTLLVNTRLAPRNLFLRGDGLVITTWYHKSRNLTGNNKPRMTFLPGGLSRLLHLYLAFVRPVEV